MRIVEKVLLIKRRKNYLFELKVVMFIVLKGIIYYLIIFYLISWYFLCEGVIKIFLDV